MKECKIVAIIPTGICISFSAEPISSLAPAFLSRLEIASASPIASGSTQTCQPANVESTQSVRAKAGFPVTTDCGKKVVSSSHNSAIEKASETFATSLAPIGAEPLAVTIFFALSRTIFFGSASADEEKPGLFIPNFENCS